MSPEQFKTTSFVYGMKVLYKGEERLVLEVSFYLKEIYLDLPKKWLWVKFLEVELIKE
jgi:hypothetical protein